MTTLSNSDRNAAAREARRVKLEQAKADQLAQEAAALKAETAAAEPEAAAETTAETAAAKPEKKGWGSSKKGKP